MRGGTSSGKGQACASGGMARAPDPASAEEDKRMKEAIKKRELCNEFQTPERCYIAELHNTPDDPAASIARARVAPGVTTRWHRLKETAERYFIVSGKGIVEVGQQPPQEVNAGDMVLIPPMCRQRIANIGSEDLIFLAVCTPRFTKNVYEDIEDNPTC